ncbi:MAG: hypothetical protein EOM72_10910 [Opitutae bacterium]|nr:hypothetical protein [Opitutae bacterium]
MRRGFSTEKGRAVGLALAAMAAAFALYAPSIGHGFCLMDDEYFVLGNPVVQGGLTGPGIQAAWTTVQASYWAPLLWMSFMVDQELSGGAPWSFHLSNVVLFAASVGLLFALVRRWTGRNGVAFATALLWAFHPARVESVAWITERKDVLSGLFFLAGLWFYTVGRGRDAAPSASVVLDPNSPDGAARRPYLQPSTLILLSWLCMLLGGMAKQIVIVMPVAMVLLDVWPLGRTDWNRIWKDVWKLAAEKWAFWLLTAAYVGLAVWTQAGEQAIVEVSWRHRLAMIPIHYGFYFQKLVCPTALAPLQADLPWSGWQMGAGLGALAGLTALASRVRVKAPWALWGWLWFVGLLFPFSGVVWAGAESVAMRWLYLPQIGLTVAAVLALDALGRMRGSNGRWVRVLGAGVLLISGGATLRTLSHWRDPNAFGLWIYECHPEQGGACAMGGDTFMALGEWAEAMKAFEQGVARGDKACFLRLGMVWNHLGHAERTAAAWDEFEKQSGRPLAQFAAWERPQERELLWRVRGQALRAQGDLGGAIAALKEAVRWEADSGAFVLAEYLRACHEGGRPEEGAEAAERMAEATGIRVREWRDLFPCYAQMWKMGARGCAYVYFADYAARFPEDAVNLNYLAWLLATAPPDRLDHARMDEWPQAAVRWAEQALASSDAPPAGVWQVLAAARANAGDSSGAVRAAEQARDLAQEKGDKDVVAQLERQIMAYRMGLAWRE